MFIMNRKIIEDMKLVLPELPFSPSSLLPHMSEETLSYHHGKHHQNYVTKSLSLLNQSDGEKINLFSTLKTLPNSMENPLFFNLAQVFNHNLFWLSLENTPITQNEKSILSKYFGSYDKFCHEFVHEGMNRFGSGWVWLLKNEETCWIETTKDGYIPEKLLLESASVVTICDVWEHAYYIDYRNNKKTFLENFVNGLMKLNF
jgi:Fe-Mn family superoxide dismutase